MEYLVLAVVLIIVVAFIFFLKTFRVVPQQMAYVVERLGKFNRTLEAGLHIIIPIIDTIRYKHSLKQSVLDIPEQIGTSKDDIRVEIHAVLFFQVIDPVRATYGVADLVPSLLDLVQATLRTVIQTSELKHCLYERSQIARDAAVAIKTVTGTWGVETRFELKDIKAPQEIVDMLEKQKQLAHEQRMRSLAGQ